MSQAILPDGTPLEFITDPNWDGAQFADRNSRILQALATANSGPTEPPVTYGGMLWHDTANAQLKFRNADNTAWIDPLSVERAELADLIAQLGAAIDGAGDLVADEVTALWQHVVSQASNSAAALAGFDLSAIAADLDVSAIAFAQETFAVPPWLQQRCAWYREPLNTATRGGRRDMPVHRLAVLTTDGRFVIFDCDQTTPALWHSVDLSGYTLNAVAVSQGKYWIGTTAGLIVLDYVTGDVTTAPRYTTATTPAILSDTVRSVAVKIRRDAPIDPATGLPVATVAVGLTGGGAAVVKTDGSISTVTTNSGTLNNGHLVDFDGDDLIVSIGAANPAGAGTYVYTFDGVPAVSTVISYNTKNGSTVSPRAFYSYQLSDLYRDLPLAGADALYGAPSKYAGGMFNARTAGVVTLFENPSDPTRGGRLLQTTAYTSGVLWGDCRGAWLCDTDDTDLVGSGELVTNGTFDTDTDWTKGTGWTISGGVASASSAGSDLYQSVAGVSGNRYVITFTVSNRTSGSVIPYIYGTAGTAVSANGTCTQTIVAGGGANVVLRGLSSFTGNIDNISVKLADADRSVNNNGLIVNGTVRRSKVHPDSDLVEISECWSNNYLIGENNSALAVGTSDYTVVGWLSADAFSGRAFFDMFNAANTGVLISGYGGTLRVFTYTGTGNLAMAGVSGLPTSTHLMVTLRRSDVTKYDLFINRDLRTSSNIAGNSDLSGNMSVLFGRSNSSGPLPSYGGYGSKMALWRVFANAITDDQIAFTEQLERFWFNGGKATIPGTSDAILSLSYDRITGLHHVLTSQYLAVFSNGVLVDQEQNTGGWTKVSAHNGMVVKG